VAEGEDELEEFVYLEFEDALEIFAAITGGTAQQAAISCAVRRRSRVRSAGRQLRAL
jgi:hypothetical protein